MPERDEEFTDYDNSKRRIIESASIVTTDSYASVSFPLKAAASPVVGANYLDRYPKRVVGIKNTGAKDLLFQVEGSLEQNPNNGTDSHWATLDGRVDFTVVAGALRFETSLDVPWTAIRVRVKSKLAGQPTNVTVFVALGKW